jgi:hypothetical protein
MASGPGVVEHSRMLLARVRVRMAVACATANHGFIILTPLY